MVFHYPFDPWAMADAIERQDKPAIKAANTPVLYGHDHALQEFSKSDCYWHFDSHLTSDKPRLRIPDAVDVDHENTEVDANRVSGPIGVRIEPNEVSEPIGVLIEY